MFGSILTLTVILLHLYVFGRGLPAPRRNGRIPPLYLICVCVLPLALFLVGRGFHHRSAGVGPWLADFATYWTATVFILAVSTLAVDLATGFGCFIKGRAATRKSLTMVLGAGLCIFALIQGFRAPVIREHEVPLAGLPKELDGKTLAVLSDLHLGSVLGAKWMAARAAQVEALKPDMVVLLGDNVEGHAQPDPSLLAALRRLSAPMGVYAVMGNHERFRSRDMPRLEDMGFTVLKDSWATAAPGLTIAGLDYVRGDGVERIPKAVAGRPAGALIMLEHMPEHAREIAAAGAGLMLAGHTHGGQIWPFNYMVQRRFPFIDGRYAVDGMPLIVSRGTGLWGARMRLWRPGEILKIVLRRRDA